MRRQELLLYGAPGKLLERLRDWGQARGIWVRDVALPATGLDLIRSGSRGVVVLWIGRDLKSELEALRDVRDASSATTIMVVSDVDQPALEGLVYDLGASLALFPPHGGDMILDVLSQSGWFFLATESGK